MLLLHLLATPRNLPTDLPYPACGGGCLIRGNDAERHQHCWVDRPCIVQKCSDDLLNVSISSAVAGSPSGDSSTNRCTCPYLGGMFLFCWSCSLLDRSFLNLISASGTYPGIDRCTLRFSQSHSSVMPINLLPCFSVPKSSVTL